MIMIVNLIKERILDMKINKKRTLAYVLAVAALVSILLIPINASTTCIEHGPFDRICTKYVRTDTYTHNYKYEGYLKQCSYKHRVWQHEVSCSYCGTVTSTGNHSHGYFGHASGCGMVNSNKCYM